MQYKYICNVKPKYNDMNQKQTNPLPGKGFAYKVGETTEELINKLSELSIWCNETMFLISNNDMFRVEENGGFKEEDTFLGLYFELKKEVEKYVGRSIGTQIDAQDLALKEPLTEVTI